jgi:hypothetical protein
MRIQTELVSGCPDACHVQSYIQCNTARIIWSAMSTTVVARFIFFYDCGCSLKFARPKVECKQYLANIALLLYSFMPFCCTTCANFKMRLNQF